MGSQDEDICITKRDSRHFLVHLKNTKTVVVRSSDSDILVTCISSQSSNTTESNTPFDKYQIWTSTQNRNLYRLCSKDIQSTSNSSGDTIFSDLLQPSPSHLAAATQDCVVTLDDTVAVFISTDGTIIQLCHCDQIVAMIIDTSRSFKLLVYNEKDIIQRTGDIQFLISVDLAGLRVACEFATDHMFGLWCVGMNRGSGRGVSRETHVIRVTPDTFSGLFGDEAFMLKSGVVLVSDARGTVYYAVMKSLRRGKRGDFAVLCKTGSEIVGIHCLTIRSDISELPPLGDCRSDRSCVVILSKNGRCLFAYVDDLSPRRGVIFQPVELFPPILSSTTDGTYLFYSTRSDVFRLTLNKGDNPACVSYDVKGASLGYSGMRLVCIKPTGGEGGVYLYGQTDSHRLYVIDASATRDYNTRWVSSQLKDLLVGIKQTAGVIETHDQKLRELSVSLSQLSLASHIAMASHTSLVSHIKTDVNSKQSSVETTTDKCLLDLILFDVSCAWENLGSRQDYSIMCKLTNESHASFTPDWGLVVRLTIYDDLERTSVSDVRSQSISFSKPFSTHRFECVLFRLDAHSLALPIFSVDSYLTLNARVSPERSCVSIPLKRVSLDMINFLRCSQQGEGFDQSNVSRNVSDLSSREIIQTLADHRSSGSDTAERDSNKTTNHVFTVYIDLPFTRDESETQVLQRILSQTLTTSSHTQHNMCTPCGDVISFGVTHNKLVMLSTNLSVLSQLRHCLISRLYTDSKPRGEAGDTNVLEKITKMKELQQMLASSPMDTGQLMEVDATRSLIDRITHVYTQLRSCV